MKKMSNRETFHRKTKAIILYGSREVIAYMHHIICGIKFLQNL